MKPFPFLIAGIFLVSLTEIQTLAKEEKENKLPDKAKAILEKAEQLEFYSLEPDDRKKQKDDETFHGWKVLGKTILKEAKLRKELLDSLNEGISKSNGVGAKCFDPRHGIRASVDGKAVDLVICFECNWVYVFYDKTNNRQGVTVTTGTPQATFDRILKDAKVPLPKQAKE